MDYRKEYEEAVKRAMAMIKVAEKEEVYKCAITIFPELKELEDEKIKKALIEHFRWNAKQILNEFSNKKALAWLEKQGEQKPIIEIKSPEESLGVSSKEYNEIVNKCLYGESKPTEKVEPKSEIIKDTWYICTYTTCAEDARIWFKKGIAYLGSDILKYDLGFEPNEYQDYFRLWTIADAKEGDVLHSTGFYSDCIFIFNRLDSWKFDEPDGERAVATGYCCLTLSADNMEFGIQGPDCIKVDTVKPATKIQRDLLFQKMKEAGYEWDFKKKELKKIEQKPVSITDEWIEDYWRHHKVINPYSHDKGEEIQFDHQGFVRFCKKYCKKPTAWGEEDERLYRGLQELIYSTPYCNSRKKISDWLKSLKDRMGK